MSVKNTVTLTRQEAETRWRDYVLSTFRIECAMSDRHLEEALERLNDAERGGEGLVNFHISRRQTERQIYDAKVAS